MRRLHRSTRNLTRATGAAVLSGAFLLAGCGSSDTEATTADSAATSPTSAMSDGSASSMAGSGATTDSMSGATMADSGGQMAAPEPSGPGCSAVPTTGAGSFAGMAEDPAATAASNNPVLSTLVSAVGEAGLVDTLNGPGPFTIFAPTNDAFSDVPADQLSGVMADKTELTTVLTNHVIAGQSLDAEQLEAAGTETTVAGTELTFDKAPDGTLLVNGAKTVCMDVPTANATVHIIDQVLLP